ncbi:hypothetical protein BH11ACT3_BH11ACT3_01670 [soil metagenome]
MDSEPDAPKTPRAGSPARSQSGRPAQNRPAKGSPAAKKAAANRKPAPKTPARPNPSSKGGNTGRPSVAQPVAPKPTHAAQTPRVERVDTAEEPVEIVDESVETVDKTVDDVVTESEVDDAAAAVPTPPASGPSFRLSFSPISKPSLGRFTTPSRIKADPEQIEHHEDELNAPEVDGVEVDEAEADESAVEAVDADSVEAEGDVEAEAEPEAEPEAEEPEAEDEPAEAWPQALVEEPQPEPEPAESPFDDLVDTSVPSTSPTKQKTTSVKGSTSVGSSSLRGPSTGSITAVSSDVALSVRGLTKRFGSVVAVDSADLEVKSGSFYGFVGPNGAGKTTTLSMVTGLLRPDAGIVKVYGADVWRNAAVAKRMLGVLPDRLRLFDRLTGAEYLHHAGGLRGLDRKTTVTRTADLVAAFGLEHSLHRFVSDYSAGMVKKIAIAAAMIHSPRLLVLDEPFESVDPVSAQVVIDILKKFTAAGGTVLLSSHSMDLIQRVCDSVAIIADGRMLAAGTLDEVLAGGTLEDRFVELAGGATAVEGMEWLHSYSD